MKNSIQKTANNLLFLNRGFYCWLFFWLPFILQAQDSLFVENIHIEGGAIVYSADSVFSKNSGKNFSAASENLEIKTKNSDREQKDSLSGQLAKAENRKLQEYKAVQKRINSRKILNLPKERFSFLLRSSMKNSFFTAFDNGSSTSYVNRLYKVKKKDFRLKKISKIHFKNIYQESSGLAFSYFSRPPPVLGQNLYSMRTVVF